MEVPEVAVTESEQEIGPNETSQNASDNSSKASKAENVENQDSEPTDLEESKEQEGPEVNDDPKEIRDSTMEKNGQNWKNGENGEQAVVKNGGEVEEVNGEVKAVNGVNGNNTLELALPKPERDEKKDEDALKKNTPSETIFSQLYFIELSNSF